eukprot:gnl/TRDRNA2_/TRDRNA2_166783_c0_seq1.p1 gnl/TRDRNA2_/TRDRNA2_166783_c0~~gnl/TRDRNA2_/TRDRNA2_166783_c0_seq1.p1  ORF type:complete len:806 (-),score=177.79 gnl/TRDRNA2_/TRDRNA2_166783_c0_seq1:137-2482(-)
MAEPELNSSSEEPAKASPAADSETRQQAQTRFQRIYAELLVEGTVGSDASTNASWSVAAAESIRLVQTGKPAPKYFSGAPNQEVIAGIDAVVADGAREAAQTELDNHARLLCGDMFNLCMTLKPRPGVKVTSEDPNFDPERVDKFFKRISPQAQDESLKALGGLLDAILEQGVVDLGASPPKLRAVLMALSHPRITDTSDESDDESFEIFKKLLRLVGLLTAEDAVREMLVRWFSAMPLEALRGAVGHVQQFLTVSLLMAQAEVSGDAGSLATGTQMGKWGDLARHSRNALRLMNVYFLANEERRRHAASWQVRWKQRLKLQAGEAPAAEMSLPVGQFQNDAINDCEGLLKHDLKEVLEVQQGGGRFPSAEDGARHDFGVVEFPFVLTAVSKVRMLSIESLITQREEVRTAVHRQVLGLRLTMNPFLVLKVKRDAVVENALQQLAIHGSEHFKKPLKVVFDGEEGVDEGGVQKEFFQLLIEELYNEDFGMFERADESRNFWFNKNSFETTLQFELFGIVLGLAIYNQAILDVKFPMVIYKKLMGGKHAELGLSDLLDFQPSLAKGFIQLLLHDDAESFTDTYGPLFFVVQYEVFGCTEECELKPGGKEIPVTFETREEYVNLYCDWIFNASVERQFQAFRKGFDKCIGDTLFRQLFRPEDLELVICGQPELDFHALEKSTSYQDGFSQNSQQIKWLWEVVHSFSEEDKRSFLQFCTGCDRAPVGGLSRLPFCVSRAGPDSDMLPSAHTCFNHLLVQEYSSKEKLERLLKLAISHCHGFGLL